MRHGTDPLSGQVANVEAIAQRLLSCELTNILAGVQDRNFGGADFSTADFGRFKSFVAEVDRAAAAFDALEKGLPADDSYKASRAAFYASCRAWRDFVGVAGAGGSTSELGMSVTITDPVTARAARGQVQDTAQHFYDDVELDIGLTVDGGQGPLRLATEVGRQAGPRRATWNWATRAADPELRVALVNGREVQGGSGVYPNIVKSLGTSSPMAFCAYLQRYGSPEGETWVVSHSFNLIEELKAQGKGDMAARVPADKSVIGVGLVFTLDRAMPQAIPRIQACRGAGLARASVGDR
jgi:hypothetical protein